MKSGVVPKHNRGGKEEEKKVLKVQKIKKKEEGGSQGACENIEKTREVESIEIAQSPALFTGKQTGRKRRSEGVEGHSDLTSDKQLCGIW